MDMLTITQIADLLCEPPARLNYHIAKHRMKATMKVGVARLFTPKQVETLKGYLFEMRIQR